VVNNVNVSLGSGWNGVGFQCQRLTALSSNAQISGQASWNGSSYATGNFELSALNSAGLRNGFWVFAQNATSFTYSGNDDGLGNFVLLDKAGYNLVSFCTSGDLPGSSITATQNGASVPLGSVVLPQFFEIGPDNQYVTVDVQTGGVVKPGKAYWIFANTANGAVRLNFSPPAPSPTPTPVTSPTPAASPSPTPVPTPTPSPSPAAASLQFLVQPPATVAAGASLPNLQVQARRADGSPATGLNVTLSLAAGAPSGGALTGTVTQTTIGTGVATFAGLSLNAAGTYQLVATSGSTTTTSATVTVAAGAAAAVRLLQAPTGGTVGTSINPFIRVDRTDASGNHLTAAGVPITVTVNTGPGTLGGTATVNTDANGSATLASLTLSAAGAHTLSVSDGVFSATTPSFTVAAAATGNLAFSIAPVASTAGATMATVQVRFENPAGTLDSATNLPITLSTMPGTQAPPPSAAFPFGGFLQPPRTTSVTVTPTGGIANFTTLAPGMAGTYVLVASANGYPSLASATFPVNAGTVAAMRFAPAPVPCRRGQTSTRSWSSWTPRATWLPPRAR